MDGEVYTDFKTRLIYATDASVYREIPIAVATPKNGADIKKLVHFALENDTSLIPRTAGTSLAGQVVGKGIIVDISKHLNKIIEINTKEKWVKVEPGIVRDNLNHYLKKYNLFFAPETSTSNRAMIGGMIGNNSCGANSIRYGSTREHLLELKTVLSNGDEAYFGSITDSEFLDKIKRNSSFEEKIYQQINTLLSDSNNRKEIYARYPKSSIKRRNTGYALDYLINLSPFKESGDKFNFCQLLAGSEGTLSFVTEAKLNLEVLENEHKALLCPHFSSMQHALEANIIAMTYSPSRCELIDHHILERTKDNILQKENRFFVQGDPQAMLLIEFSENSKEELDEKIHQLTRELEKSKLADALSIVAGDDIQKVWSLRKAGLGLLFNTNSEEKPVAVIEDTAVDIQDLPAFIDQFNKLLKDNNLFCVHYGHAGAGELHLRPFINLKTEEGNKKFRKIAEEVAELIKKYEGSISGEHGDGRLRGEFIPQLIGEKNYKLLREVKKIWDPNSVFNPAKIVDTPMMDTYLRYSPTQKEKKKTQHFNWEKEKGFLQATEKCNGSGDCRKLSISGGTMCPSFMASKNERDTTRARANILREFLTSSETTNVSFKEAKDVLDLCLSCKACKSECPSSVDMAKMKAEFLQLYHDKEGIDLNARLIGNFTQLVGLGSMMPKAFNFFASNKLMSSLIKSTLGFSQKRELPKLQKKTLRNWYRSREIQKANPIKKVYFFCDEFTNYTDSLIGIKAINLLEDLGYQVGILSHAESGRTFFSKGMLKKAKEVAVKNVELLKDTISSETPLIGLEPSAILSFRDEYLDLLPPIMKKDAQKIADNSFLIDEFIEMEYAAGNIRSDSFTEDSKNVFLHVHCHQKAFNLQNTSKNILSIPKNYNVELMKTGCCGMAGSFGYEKEHYDLSMQIGELVLFPKLRSLEESDIIAATGTSCREQIKDGVEKRAYHPVEILYNSLKK